MSTSRIQSHTNKIVRIIYSAGSSRGEDLGSSLDLPSPLSAFIDRLRQRGAFIELRRLSSFSPKEFSESYGMEAVAPPTVLAFGNQEEEIDLSDDWQKVLDPLGYTILQAPDLRVYIATWNSGIERLPPPLRELASGSNLGHEKDMENLLRVLGFSAPATKTTQGRNPPLPPEPTAAGIQYTSVADIPSPHDTLGFAPYVDAMATFLANEHTRPPLTLSIEGEWGSGKSSFMLQLEESLHSKLKGQARFVRFNAWRYEKGEALWASFALEFSRQVAPTSMGGRIFARLGLGIARLLNGQGWLGLMKLIMPLVLLAIASWFSIDTLQSHGKEAAAILALVSAPLSVPLLKKVWDFFGNPFSVDLHKIEAAPDYESRIPFLEQFHEDFRLVLNHYAGGAKKVFVFVDDLDRCEVPKAAELLQALNLMMPEDSKVIFILGVDREKVAAGIAVRNEKLLPLLAPPNKEGSGKLPFDPLLAVDFGHDFLERFIQLPFRVPQPTGDQLNGLVGQLLAPSAPGMARSPTPPIRPTASSGEPATGATILTSSASEAVPEPIRARRAAIIHKAETDSVEVHEVMKMVAPALDFNPRRLKQFLNVFRLSAYIAQNTGLFDAPLNSQHALSLPQLGKFVAIALRWPRLLRDIEEDPELIIQLEDPKSLPTSPAAMRWKGEAALLRLLQAKYEGAESQLPWMGPVDFRKLRSISPTVYREAPESLRLRQADASSGGQDFAEGPSTTMQEGSVIRDLSRTFQQEFRAQALGALKVSVLGAEMFEGSRWRVELGDGHSSEHIGYGPVAFTGLPPGLMHLRLVGTSQENQRTYVTEDVVEIAAAKIANHTFDLKARQP